MTASLRSGVSRVALFVTAAAMGVVLPGNEPARAACSPAAGPNVSATCSGTTTNQGGGAPGTSAGTNGFGTGVETGLNVTVVPGATVTGTGLYGAGIRASTVTITNSGTISTTRYDGVTAGSATVTNAGTISGLRSGVHTFSTANVVNSGAISGFTGIYAVGAATVTNSGTISGDADAVRSFTTATVTNSGVIRGGLYGGGVYARNNAIVTNSGTISGAFGVLGINAASITNTGTISGTIVGVAAGTASVSNSGTISGAFGVDANTASITNTGTISGTFFAIGAVTANVSNSGVISGGQTGIAANSVTVANAGLITGNTGIRSALYGSGAANVTNSGTIVGTGGTALQFSGAADTLTILPGSRILGAINLGGGGDTVNILAPNQALTFDTLAGATVTSNVPVAIAGDRVATIDSTGFGMADRTVMDFTRALSGIIGSRAEEAAAEAGAPTNLYAASTNVAYDPTATAGNGTALWARGFYGRRVQQADGDLLRNNTDFFGGAIGADRAVRPDLRLGAFAGGGNTSLAIDNGAGSANTDIAFAGLYGRYTLGVPFVDFALTGGYLANSTVRSISNNLAAGGTETARASFGGWFIDPEIGAGWHQKLDDGWRLTPALRARYVAAGFDGFSESGSSANLSVGDRLVSDFEESAEVALGKSAALGDGSVLTVGAHVGALALQRAGNSSINAVLIGQSLTFATPGRNYAAGLNAGLAVEWRMHQGMSLYAAGDAASLSDSSNIFTGRAGLRVLF